MGARNRRRVRLKRNAIGAIREDRLSRLPFEVLFKINNHLPFKDCHSLQVTNRINATVSRAHLDRVFMTDKDVRHRIPKYKYPFVKGSYAYLREDGEGGLYEEATTLQYAIYHENHIAVGRLIDRGWNVNEALQDEPNGCARSPLGLAAQVGNERILRMLMRAGAEVEWNMPRGYATMLAVKSMEVQTWITEELEKRHRLLRRFRRNCRNL
jgi:hypothetical protein